VQDLKNSVSALVTIFNSETKVASITVANNLRQQGINCLLYPDPSVKIDKQLKYASRKGIPIVLIIGPEEIETSTVTIKWMAEKRQERVTLDSVADYLT
jgi:histidyl-tRNA synthetase